MKIKDILKLTSGLYTTTMDGEEVQIRRDADHGFEVVHPPKANGWCEVTIYDEDGNIEGQTVEKH